MGLFGGSSYKDPSKAAMPYLDSMPDILKQYYQPYMDAGNSMLPGLQEQFGQSMNDPGALLNKIGGNYQKSPGFDFAMQQALQGGNHAAAAGGMAGSPQHEQQNMQMATNMANQDYDRWMKEALGIYEGGMGGAQNMYGLGAQAGMGLGTNLADIQAQKAKMAYEKAKSKNENRGNALGAFGTLGGAAIGGAFGGPAGAGLGANLGGAIAGMF